jgi:predicted dehydrogenase
MKIGIIGAGNNADYHVKFAQAHASARVVGIADTDLARGEEYARRYGIERAYASAAELLAGARPDVVHVVTPPRTHYAVVTEVLEAGAHALVEKPFALNLREAQALYDLAERRAVQLCPVHNHLFDPCMRRADALIQDGRLGRIVNVESYYGLNTNIPPSATIPGRTCCRGCTTCPAVCIRTSCRIRCMSSWSTPARRAP